VPTSRQHTPFADLAEFVALPRLSSLALSPDGHRLVTVVSELAPDGKTWQGALWEVDPAGQRQARRLTHAAKGESAPVFTPDGSLLFISARRDEQAAPDAARSDKDKDTPALWLLPPVGEARQVFSSPGGVQSVGVARESGRVLLATAVYPAASFGEQDQERQRAREDAGVTAILHEAYPVRYWDHDLGPRATRLAVASAAPTEDGRLGELTDLTPDADGRVQAEAAISADGAWVAYRKDVDVSAAYGRRVTLRLVGSDGSGERVLVDSDRYCDLGIPVFATDGSFLVCPATTDYDLDRPPRRLVLRVDTGTGEITELASDFPQWPEEAVIAPDGSAVYFAANRDGRRPVWRLELASGEITRLTGEGAYTDLSVAPDGSAVYALRASIDQPPRPVRIDPRAIEQDAVGLPAPGAVAELPGDLTEIDTPLGDGRTVRAWLAVPHGTSAQHPVPLLLWVHGGPLMSWNSWSWRWNPWTAVARGYAVLLPDPALSTGYGPEHIAAGWSAWGAAPYTDLMAITDAAVARPEIDKGRTAAMGGSFGGYMANWIATQTDRFRAIVTHASLWHLDAFTGTTDDSYQWLRELADPLRQPERIVANSPHLRVADIRTPMLVIHGDKDYRVPIGEGLRLYFDLVRHEVPARFLYFPTENHWVLTPGNSRVWYETVFAFLAEHVLGEPWQRPALL
jgi:dipeptidyl aminopeptidase/acylaminoacyl peptidase